MEGLFTDFGGFFIDDGEVEANNVADNLGNDYGAYSMMMPAAMSSFSNGTAPEMLHVPADWYTQFSDLHLPDNEPIYGVQSDNLSLDVTDYFQENDCLIDQYIHDNETWTLQVQEQAAYCHDGHHQRQSSTSFIPDYNVLLGIDNHDDLINISSTPEQRQLPIQQEPPGPRGPQQHRSELFQLPVQELQDDALPGIAEGNASVKGAAITHMNICNDDSDDENYDDEDNIGDDNQLSSVISKNLMSERNRRKRLNKQFFTLRSMVPNITKMDKRSVLGDALTYLQDILDQTKIEIKNQNNLSTAAAVGTGDPGHAVVNTQRPPDSSTENAEINHPHFHDQTGAVLLEKKVVDVNVEAGQLQLITSTEMLELSVLPYEGCAIFPAITKMEAEKVDEQTYVLKIVFKKAMGAMGQVQRAVEMLNGFHCINVSVSEYDQHHTQSSSFLRVKKTKGSLTAMDEECILDKMKMAVEQLGLLLLPPNPSSV